MKNFYTHVIRQIIDSFIDARDEDSALVPTPHALMQAVGVLQKYEKDYGHLDTFRFALGFTKSGDIEVVVKASSADLHQVYWITRKGESVTCA